MTNKASIYDLVGDLVIFRDLDPVDPRLPRFADAWRAIGLPDVTRPRKHEPAYAQTMAWYLRRARALDRSDVALTELVYLGDTAMSDGNAFRNLRAAGGWRGWAFIAAEQESALYVKDEELVVSEKNGVYQANRWSALAEFASWLLTGQAAALDERTAVIVDIDKTALGGRGRNDGAIDRARVTAIEATVADALGPAFDPGAFRRAYAAINAPKYHPFTADNQDYVAYVCLMVGAGFTTIEALLADVDAGRLTGFRDFIAQVQACRDRLPSDAVRSLHSDIYARVQAGDATPFKAFRRREYRETVGRMGSLPDQTPLAQRLVEEICLTREVVEFALWLRGRGCLLLALSDKPDEASLPTPELATQGYLPLHRAATHVVGQSIAALLPDN
jgi:hypothetical protein